jgi:hypothetical protein
MWMVIIWAGLHQLSLLETDGFLYMITKARGPLNWRNLMSRLAIISF